ncbi:MAG: carbonic anhydrase [Candidatus Acidiferrales bacterium]
MRKSPFLFALMFLVAIFAPPAARAQWKTPWSYEGPTGPQHWAHLDRAYSACNGKEQSPIDIRNAKVADLPPLRFRFKNGPLSIINNGYTAVRVDYARGNGNVLLVGRDRYELTQFHFHRPSEEYIAGKPFDMVIHFMFQSSDGKVAGLAVLVNAGKPNAAVQKLWKYMPKVAGKDHTIPGVYVNPAALLPLNTSYYTYMGSISAPPCTEGVKWFVLKRPVEISRDQINAFAKLYPHDVRPPQPLNGRVVLESR